MAFALALPNAILVVGVAGWVFWACIHNNLKHMSRGSFVLFIFWMYTGIARALLSPDPGQLLWVPFIIIAMVMSVVYLYLSHQKRIGDLD